MSSKQTSLLRVDIKSPSDDASQDGTSVQLDSEQLNDFTIDAALEKSMLKINQLKLVENRLKVKNLKQRREFCENLNAQSSKSETLHAAQQVQEEDDKRRKDAADHTEKQNKLTSAKVHLRCL
jgi:hypothetical protein